ncbi:MAG: phosphotransferase, partial [Kineosporiaceae bacterium]
RVGALAAVRDWAGSGSQIEVVSAHRRDHVLASCRTAGGLRFAKAYAPEAVDDMKNEFAAYARWNGLPSVPRVYLADAEARLLITDHVPGGRLSDLRGAALGAALAGVPALYSSLTTGPFGRAPEHPGYARAWRELEGRADCRGLPHPSVVWPIVSALPARTVHGDFQPSNILLGGNGPMAIDFESFGLDVPALDVVRLAYNPALGVDWGTRGALAADMLDHLAHDDGAVAITPRQTAACCVLWAVSCAAFFTRVLADQPQVVSHSPEVLMLATEPLRMAVRLWNQL